MLALEQPHDLTVRVKVDCFGGGDFGQAGHSQHLAADGDEEARAGRNLDLADRDGEVFGPANPVGEINVPVNFAAVLGRDGPRFSLLVGLTFSDARY